MPQPLLNLRNVRIVIESIGGGRRTQSVGAEPLDLNTCRLGVVMNDAAVDALLIEAF